ncbi:hypothetical protein EZV62_003250 [Acer yangbiense]|uniref:Uncharacterized protein n=1 Tax=Acer yangbiense TaxID=1000413 RepID=A0A5C7IGZ0_9ROSI|nr:hypothetical protein EZV62_003250 [Acer yangbiense]
MKKIFKVLNLRQFTREVFREKHLSKNLCRALSVDPAPRQVGIAVSDEQLTKWNFLRSLYLRGDCEDKESGIGLKFRFNLDLNGIVMKDQNTLDTQFMKIVKKNNVKAPQAFKGMREDEVWKASGVLKSGVHCLALFKEKDEEREILHLFSQILAIMEPQDLMDMFSLFAKAPSYFEHILQPHVPVIMEVCMINATEVEKPLSYLQLLHTIYEGPLARAVLDLTWTLKLTVTVPSPSDESSCFVSQRNMANVMSEVILASWSHLRPAPYPLGGKASQLLGKLGNLTDEGYTPRWLSSLLVSTVDASWCKSETSDMKADLGLKTKTQLMAEKSVFKNLLMTMWTFMNYKSPLNMYKEVFDKNLSRKPLNRCRLLGLDICDDHLALALSDTNLAFLSSSSKEWRLHGSAKLFGDSYNNDKGLISLSAELRALIDQHKVEGLVVGYPFRNPEKSDDGLKALMFISNLNYTQKFGGLKYTYWEKAFTPKEITIENHVELCMNRLGCDNLLLEPLVQRQRCAPHQMLQGYLYSGMLLVDATARGLAPKRHWVYLELSYKFPCHNKLLPSARLASSRHEEDEDMEIVVVNEDTHEPVEDGIEGEIWVSSPSNASGYLGHPFLTRKIFHARLGNRTSPFFIRTGERNQIQQQKSEIDKRVLRMVCEKIKRAVLDEERVEIVLVVLVRSGNIPKTTSGNIQRWVAKDRLIGGQMGVVEMKMDSRENMLLMSRPMMISSSSAR